MNHIQTEPMTPPAAPILVYVADDHAFFRAGVIAWLKGQKGVTCCGEAGTLADARVALLKACPDVLLLDLGFREGDGLQFLLEARKLQPDMRIIVVSQRDESVFAERALRAGAAGYLMKSEAVDQLLQAIRVVMSGEIYLTRAGASHVTGSKVIKAQRSDDLSGLSDRELQVFGMIGSGLGPKEIAERLSISPKTVETYREHLKRKFGVANAAALGILAVEWVQRGYDRGMVPASEA
jgi:DNA-binding NarL/FixJ family response regulator